MRAAVETRRRAAGRLRRQVEPGLPLMRADAAQLERALANVLENAGRYAAGAPVTVRARAAAPPAAAARRRPRPGHPARGARARLRALPPRRATAPGAGLGLAIARGFVEANGGRIRAESLPGQGTTFVIQLPVPVERPRGRRRPPSEQPGARLRRRAADPARAAGDPARRRLRGGHRADRRGGARRGRAARARRRDPRPGPARRRRRRGLPLDPRVGEMPILVLSAVGEEAEKIRALDAGRRRLRDQAVRPGELVARLNAALRRAGARRGAGARGRRARDRPRGAPRACATARRST